MTPKHDLTQGNIRRNLLFLALPVMVSMLLENLLIVVDTFFVAKLGPAAIAAVGAAFPLFFVMFAIAAGISIGVSALIARSIGAKKLNAVTFIAENGALLAIAGAFLITILGILSMQTSITFLGVSSDVGNFMADYLLIMYLGSIVFFLGNLGNGILQGEGDTKTPMYSVMVAALVNVILDPLLIFGFGPLPAMGVTGAALATVIARGAGTAYVFSHVLSGKALVRLQLKRWKTDTSVIKDILHIGIPSAGAYLAVAAGTLALNKLVASFGDAALAGYAIAFRMEILAILPAIAIGIATLSLVGQNAGARLYERVREAHTTASIAAFSIMEAFGLLFFVLGGLVVRAFTPEQAVIDTGSTYFLITSLTYGFVGMRFVAASAFQALGKAAPSFYLPVIRYGGSIAAGMLLAFPLGFGLHGVWMGIAAGNVLVGIIAHIWFSTRLTAFKSAA